jgi:acyl-CoA synthetase (AMP-forming)/AMP-acid ligase II
VNYRLGARLCPSHPPASVALSTVDDAVTYADLDERADRVAAGLRAAGLRGGDRVLALVPSGIETYELLLGCARAALVLVPLNWRLSRDELVAVARDARAAAVVVHPRFDAAADGLVDASGTPNLRIGPAGDDYGQWISAQNPAAAPDLPTGTDDVVLRVYTSGTSGKPKGVLLTNRNLAAKVPRAAAAWGVDAASVSLLATPLFHIGGLSWGLVGLHAGARTVIVGSMRPPDLVALLRRERVTHTFLVPTMLQDLCAAAGTDAFADLATIVFGAAPINEPTQRAVLDTFRCTLIHVYGLSETTGSITQIETRADAPPAERRQRIRSAGRAFPWVELSVRDPATGDAVPAGAVGEVWTRSDQNTPGYAGAPEATRELLTPDGWLRTGDAGYLDADGYLFLTDRLKDMIVTGGENVYPAEVEAVLREHERVSDVAVVGLPDNRWGESIAAVVVPRVGQTVDPDDILRFAAGRLAGYKRPRAAFVVAELPRNATGKVRKHELVSMLSKESL